MSVVRKLSRGLAGFALTGMLLAGAASAMPGGPGGAAGQRGPDPVTMMAERLSLTDQQKVQIQSIFEKHFAEARARHEAFEATLTPEQKAEREARRQQWQARRQQGGQVADSGQRPPRPELTPEQRQDMETRHRQMQANRQQLEAEIQAVLTPEQNQILQQMKAERPDRRGGGPRHDG